ncbi:hypothetical protein ACP70R_005460 [Stipagrostis hirtigluma subsp. patula]
MEIGRGWQELGVVDTIYEDDHEEEEEEEECFDSPTMSSSATSRSCSPPPSAAAAAHSSLPPALRRAVQEWSRGNGSRQPDVIIRVRDHCLPLHRCQIIRIENLACEAAACGLAILWARLIIRPVKWPGSIPLAMSLAQNKDAITSQSRYLRRLLSESSDVAVALPSGLTFDAFVDALASCYGADAAVHSPAGLAAAWAAAGWLELPGAEEDGLARAAEDYLFQVVATDHGRAAEVVRCCTAFLGGEAAAPAAELLVRCLEVLAASGSAGAGAGRWLEDVAALPVEEFLVAVEAMRARFAHDHDLMYTVVDHYLENHKGKLTEEEKSRVCYNVNCTKLSQHLFLHLVQNPRLPLRFVVQAMLVEQLHSHHSMLLHHHHHTAAAAAPPSALAPPLIKSSLSGALSGGAADAASMTLGDILQRDAVLRQSAHIRASMQATSARIESLERELAGLRSRLRRSEQQQQQHAVAAAVAGSAIDHRAPGKSASFRILRSRLWDGEDLAPAAPGRTAAKDDSASARGFRSRLVHGFKNLFGRRAAGSGAPSSCGEDASTRGVGEKCAAADAPELESDADEELRKEERRRPHQRSQSIV